MSKLFYATFEARGNVTSAEVKEFTDSNGELKPIARFGLAVNTSRKLEDGSYENGETSFFNMATFQEHLIKQFREGQICKGANIVVSGAMKTETVEKGGKTRTYTNFVAHSITVTVVPGKGKRDQAED